MHLSTLTITELRQLKHRTFDFSPGFNLLIGENGAGKTTIMKAILAAMGGANQRGPYPKLEDEDVRLNSEQARVEAEVLGLRNNAVKFKYSKRLWERGSWSHSRKERPLVLSYASNEATCSSLNVRSAKRAQGVREYNSRRDEEFLFYGTEGRSTEQSPQQSERRFGDSHTVRVFLARVLSTFSPDFKDFQWSFESYNCSLEIPPSEDNEHGFSKETEKIIRSAALRYFQEGRTRNSSLPIDWPDQTEVTLIPEASEHRAEQGNLPELNDIWKQMKLDISVDDRETLRKTPLKVYLTPRIMIRREIGPLRLNQLSDGEQRLFSLFVDIARELSLQDRVDVSIGEGKAIVLIDEIDVHLHPKWQRKIIPVLEDLFPNCQFIATTHSPFVIQAMSRQKIITIDPEKSGAIFGIANSIEDIAEEIQGIDLPQRSRRAELLNEAAQRYFSLLESKASGDAVDHDALEAAENNYRKASEPFTSNPAVHAFLKVQLLERENS